MTDTHDPQDQSEPDGCAHIESCCKGPGVCTHGCAEAAGNADEANERSVQERLASNASTGVHTPACNCGHEGMGANWHMSDCAWRQPAPTAQEQPALPEPTVRPTEYTVSLLPEDDDRHDLYAVTVQYRGHGLWAVVWSRYCLGRNSAWDWNGAWDWEPMPSQRADDWLADHRFDLDTALAMAIEAAPHVTVNGRTVADALRRSAERDTEEKDGAL